MLILLSLLLVAGAVVMLKRDNRPGAVLCSVGLLVLAIARPFLVPSGADRVNRFDKQTKEVMASVLADKVAERHAGKNIAFLALPHGFYQAKGPRASATDLMENVLKKAGLTVTRVTLPSMEKLAARLEKMRASSDLTDPEAFLEYEVQELTIFNMLSAIDTESLNQVLLDLQADYDVVVCALPLPATLVAGELLAREEGPELVLVHVQVDDLDEALRETVLDIHMGNRDNVSWEIDYDWPRDDETAFNHFYELSLREDS